MPRFNESGIQISAHLTADDEKAKLNLLDNLLTKAEDSRNEHDRLEKTLVVCSDDTSCRTATANIFLMKKYQTCIFTSDMFTAGELSGDRERRKFLSSSKHIGVCSEASFDTVDLPLIQNYVFIEFPKPLVRFSAIIKKLEETATQKQQKVHLDIIVNKQENINNLKALLMEMDIRSCALPEWLTDIIKQSFIKEENQESSYEERTRKESRAESILQSSSDDNTPPIPVIKSAPVIRKKPIFFDPYNLPISSSGNYLIPNQAVDMHSDTDDDDMNEEYYEHEYDYDSVYNNWNDCDSPIED